MPKPVPSLLALTFAALSLTTAHAAPGELVMLAPLDQTMPIVRFSNGALDGGILKDVGDALAQRLGLRAVYLSVDVAGVTPALSSGRADAMCYVMPVWIDGDYDWSTPLLPDTEMVVAHADAPRLRSLKDLRDRPIGTVAGYRYPRLEQVLGRRFFRIDSASMDANVQQMVAGKVQYTLAGENTLFYLQRIHPTLKLRPELVFASFKAQCAFSRKSQVPFTDANRVIDAMLKEGVIDQIMARYR
ncbi:substrate-binding periplasmic protein [Duganella rhizosphaerae]|uniref:substrate-binding periplasmic protein n=1 Tax=Duganella rhizosphaerae TaxID=2885763 RepID=UPI00403F3588